MRHISIRLIGGFIWLAAAVASGLSAKLDLALLYVVLGGLFLYSACGMEKRKNTKGDD